MQVSQAFKDLFLENVAASLDKQAYLWENIHNTCQWECDLEKGSICFSEEFDFQIQLLGRESTEKGIWIWAWADVLPDINPDILECANNLKRVGEQLRIPELVTPKIPLSSEVQGHIIAAIASGICQAKGYYCCTSDDDCLFILIQDPKYKRSVDNPIARIASIFPNVLNNYRIEDPKTAFIEYLKFYQLDIYLSKDKIVGKSPSGEAVAATFSPATLLKIETIPARAASSLSDTKDIG